MRLLDYFVVSLLKDFYYIEHISGKHPSFLLL